MFHRSTEDILKALLAARSDSKTALCLLGGENTIRPDICRIIASAKKSGFKQIFMSTNGRMFSYRDFAKKFIDSGITGLNFSLHGPDDRSHDLLTRIKGSFRQTIEGMKNLRLLGFTNISTTTVIVRHNYKQLLDICKLSLDLGARQAGFSFVNLPAGTKNFKKIMPRISKAAPHIRQCLQMGREKDGFNCCANYVPLCYFAGHADQINRPESEDILEARGKAERCSRCKSNLSCFGIWRSYLEHYGDSELRPS